MTVKVTKSAWVSKKQVSSQMKTLVQDAGDLTQPERFVTSCHTQGMVKNHGVSQTTAPGQFPSSAGDRQSDTGVNTKIGHNRSSLLVLSSSKEDEDDRVYS